MKIEDLIESATIRDLVVMDDWTGVHVCYQFDLSTAIIHFDAGFLKACSDERIINMIEARLEDIRSVPTSTAITVTASSSGWHDIGQETGYGEIVAPGYQPVKTGGFSRLRAAAGKLAATLTRIVACGIMLLYTDW